MDELSNSDAQTLTVGKLDALIRPILRAQKEYEGRLSDIYVRMRLAGTSHADIEQFFRRTGAPDDAFRLIEGFRVRWDRIEQAAKEDRTDGDDDA